MYLQLVCQIISVITNYMHNYICIYVIIDYIPNYDLYLQNIYLIFILKWCRGFMFYTEIYKRVIVGSLLQHANNGSEVNPAEKLYSSGTRLSFGRRTSKSTGCLHAECCFRTRSATGFIRLATSMSMMTVFSTALLAYFFSLLKFDPYLWVRSTVNHKRLTVNQYS